MSFTASAARVRDQQRPLGLRVMCLHGCLERFNLFGFTATRTKLRQHVGLEGASLWTDTQLLEALSLLEQARSSWTDFAAQQLLVMRQAKRDDRNAPRPSQVELFNGWLEAFLDGGHAAEWGVESLGDCSACGHRLVHHGTLRCRGCFADRSIPWDVSCRVSMPGVRPD